jgi:hypothetical protein
MYADEPVTPSCRPSGIAARASISGSAATSTCSSPRELLQSRLVDRASPAPTRVTERSLDQRRTGAVRTRLPAWSTAPQERRSRLRPTSALTCGRPVRRPCSPPAGQTEDQTWSGSWNQLMPRMSPRSGQNGPGCWLRRVITAGQAWCPRQDSNLRHRLRRPVDVVITDAFRCPTWAVCSRLVSPVASYALWFVPRDVPRRVSSVDECVALVLGESSVALDGDQGW